MNVIFHNISYLYSRCRVHVTRSGTMHLTLSCEVHRSRIIQRILDSLRMVTSVLSNYTDSCVSFVYGFSSITPLFSGTPILDV
jgi:hypothetical protein